MKIKLSLKKIWLALVLLTGLIPVCVVVAVYSQQFYQYEVDTSLAIERKSNELIRGQIISEIKRLETLLNNKSDAISVLMAQDVIDGKQADVNYMLSSIVKRENAIHESVLLDLNGNIISAIDEDLDFTQKTTLSENELLSVKGHFNSNMSATSAIVAIPSFGRIYIGSPRWHMGEIVVDMSVPVGNPTKAILATLIHVDELWLDSKFVDKNENVNQLDYILDGSGKLITKVGELNLAQTNYMTGKQIVRSALSDAGWDEKIQYKGILGDDVFGTYTIIPRLNWILMSEVKVGEISQPIIYSLIIMIATTLTGILIFMLLVFYLAKRTIAPIQKACEAIDAVSGGNFDYKLEPCGVIELDAMSAGFNSMIDARRTSEEELLENQKQLSQSEEIFRGVIELSIDGVVLINQNGKIELVNKSLLEMSGYRSSELIGSRIDEILPDCLETQEQIDVCFNGVITHATITSCENIALSCKNGGELPVEIRLTPVVTEFGKLISIMIQDVSLRKKAEEKILFQAHYDALTKLPNRFLSLDRLSQMIAEGNREDEKVAVLFLDLDDFKKVNDSLGHEVGDKLLIEAATRLVSAVRGGDTVGRLGGDEFIVLLGGLSTVEDASAIAENIINSFRNSFKVDGREFMLTISVGVALYPGDGDSESELLRNADSAMYHSKSLGRNTYSYFTNEMNQNVSRRLSLEEQLHGALERNEFEVFYQPKVRLSDGELIGAEALIRWTNSALGSVPPDEFISIAERSGQIIDIGKFVLVQAVKFIKNWQVSFGAEFRLAVNLSPRQFRDPDLVAFLLDILDKEGVSPECLEMEVTEGVLMSGHSYVIDAIEQLKNNNITIAMDDFGTGYSSLSYLRKFPFDVLKIDRSFVSDISESYSDRKLVQASIAMAQSLNLKVVAEGVETEEQLEFLRDLECDYGQGFLFGKPMPAEDMASMFKNSRVRLIYSN